MEILPSKELDGVKIIKNFYSSDSRGSFTKIINEDDFLKNGMVCDFKESYYSMSNKDVVRGMHFQIPPYDHEKLVNVIKGCVVDVLLDLRKDSKTYGRCSSVMLKDSEHLSLYIPKGFAHGFKCLEDNTIMLYNVTSVYNRECDCGVLWSSIPYDWNIENPILADRDKGFVRLEDFKSPF